MKLLLEVSANSFKPKVTQKPAHWFFAQNNGLQSQKKYFETKSNRNLFGTFPSLFLNVAKKTNWARFSKGHLNIEQREGEREKIRLWYLSHNLRPCVPHFLCNFVEIRRLICSMLSTFSLNFLHVYTNFQKGLVEHNLDLKSFTCALLS